MAKILNALLPFLVEAILKVIPPERLVKYADRLLDWCEEAIEKSPSEYDDMLLPLIKVIREAFDIPDGEK